MKVRKEVSLTPETYAIAAKMPNFSQWVRIGLRMYDMKEDLASETMRRMQWAHAARHLAATLVERAKEIDPNTDVTVDMLIKKAITKQTWRCLNDRSS